MEEPKTKVCNCCGKVLPIERFKKTSNYKDGYYPICRECEMLKWKKKEWTRHNLALEDFPWPFDNDRHKMDIKAIREHIKFRKCIPIEEPDVREPVVPKGKRYRKRKFEL